jgi:hypothetical protein
MDDSSLSLPHHHGTIHSSPAFLVVVEPALLFAWLPFGLLIDPWLTAVASRISKSKF